MSPLGGVFPSFRLAGNKYAKQRLSNTLIRSVPPTRERRRGGRRNLSSISWHVRFVSWSWSWSSSSEGPCATPVPAARVGRASVCAVCVQVWVSVGTDPRSDEFEAGSAPKFQKRRAVDGPTRLMRLSRGLGVGGGGGGGGGWWGARRRWPSTYCTPQYGGSVRVCGTPARRTRSLRRRLEKEAYPGKLHLEAAPLLRRRWILERKRSVESRNGPPTGRLGLDRQSRPSTAYLGGATARRRDSMGEELETATRLGRSRGSTFCAPRPLAWGDVFRRDGWMWGSAGPYWVDI